MPPMALVLLLALFCLAAFLRLRKPKVYCEKCARTAAMHCALCGMQLCQRHSLPTVLGWKAVQAYPNQYMCPACFEKIEADF